MNQPLSAGFMYFVAILSVISLTSCAKRNSPRQIVEEHFKVKNSHHVTAEMRFFSDNSLLEIPGLSLRLTGIEKRRAIAEYDSVLNTILTPSDFEVRGDTVFCSITEHNDWLAAAGIPDAYYPRTVTVVEANKIVYSSGHMSDSSRAYIGDVLSRFMPWAGENYPEAIAGMMPEGRFSYNAENAVLILRLLRQWRQTSESESAD